jgi:hypothetical protein
MQRDRDVASGFSIEQRRERRTDPGAGPPGGCSDSHRGRPNIREGPVAPVSKLGVGQQLIVGLDRIVRCICI